MIPDLTPYTPALKEYVDAHYKDLPQFVQGEISVGNWQQAAQNL